MPSGWPTKTSRIRRVTLGAGVAALWRSTVRTWRERTAATHASGNGGFEPWLFSGHPDHAAPLTTSCLGHWFADLADRAGQDITLRRLRYTMATVLLGRGDLLQAQYRLGHRDASTTLRIYSHVLPLTDAEAAAPCSVLRPRPTSQWAAACAEALISVACRVPTSNHRLRRQSWSVHGRS